MNINVFLISISPVRWATFFVCAAIIWLFAPEIAQAAVTFGEIGQNVADNAKGVAKGVTLVGYATGVTMGVLGGVEMYRAGKHQGQATYHGGITKAVIGALLLGIGEFLGSGSATLFGSDQTSGLGDLGL